MSAPYESTDRNEPVKETVEILVRDHGVDLHKETIIHSNQGAHYTSIAFIKILKDSEIRHLLSRRGNCWDNAPQESFFGHMKDHLMERIENAKKYQQIEKRPEELGKKKDSDTEQSVDDKCS